MPPAPIRVLVVDDDSAIRLCLCAFLEDEGFDVAWADSGETALARLLQEPADIAVVDIRLPGLDGDAVILRARALALATHFLVHTGSRSYQLSADIVAAGVGPDDVFQKPVPDMSVIARAIRRKVRASEASQGDPLCR
jgi:DNA-binding response OmpR family regulator